MKSLTTSLTILLVLATVAVADDPWTIKSQDGWLANTTDRENVEVKEGFVSPTATDGTLRSVMKKFDAKRTVSSLTFEQSPVWQNWSEIENVGPINLNDAPVALSLGPNNYWMFGRHGDGRKRVKRGQKQEPEPLHPFTPEPATLEGFDMQLETTRFKNQYRAPGGKVKSAGGYHAWQSRDMVNWVHHGSITEKFAKWMTTAEYVDGKAYFYYDFPNDQDPHVYVDEDLFDGKPGKNMGLAFKDPSHGSDCGFIRDLEGNFHVIIENWSPINARKRSWDSPLASHAVSPNGLDNFKILEPAVDMRTKPTGKIGTYKHPHWANEDPENYKTNVAEYEIHEPHQPAFGDWAAIAIGGQYYLFGDYDKEHGEPMSVAWFTSSDINKPFTLCGNVGRGHPDPDICFAEGKFYLVTQQKNDYVSPGPWVDGVKARVGVDTSNDGTVNTWTEWQSVKETYDYTPGFAKQIAKRPATLDLAGLPAGFGFQFEVKLSDTTENESKPMLKSAVLDFK